MNDRFRFRARVTVSYRDKEENDKEKQLLLERVAVYSDTQMGIERWRVLEVIKKSISDKLEQRDAIAYLDDNNLGDSEDWLLLDCDIVEQCTGLEDKNDTLIYEGDILKIVLVSPNHKDLILEEKTVVYFANGSFGHQSHHIDYPLANYTNGVTFEVIGNIHENPELVEAK